MKALIFRVTTITIAIFLFLLQIEIGKLDAIMGTVSIILTFTFLIDVSSNIDNSSRAPYYNTEYGSITWLLFGKKDKK